MLISEYIKDKAFRRLMSGHEVGDGVVFGPEVEKIFDGDDFVRSQYLMGFNYFSERLGKVFTGGHNFLDLGCGGGNWSIAALKIFDNVIGIDASSKRINIAKELAKNFVSGQKKISFECFPAEKLPYNDGYFDGILCFNVITFILKQNQVNFMKEARRVTAKGGRMYIMCHDIGFLYFSFLQMLEGMSMLKIKVFVYVMLYNILYLAGIKKNPASWASERYIKSLADKSGWCIVFKGYEGDIMNCSQKPIFPNKYSGLPFAKEYILEAI